MLQVFNELTTSQPIVLALGMFDGVHIGHQALLEAQHEQAVLLGAQRLLYTFAQHPLEVLQDTSPQLLSPLDEKLSLLEQAGVDIVIAVPFTLALAQQTAGAFLQKLTAKSSIRHVVVGHDARFGAKGAGDAVFLQAFGRMCVPAFDVTALPPVMWQDKPVSSSRIRQTIQQGRCEEATYMLGRSYTVTGEVVLGAKRGRTLGFPTANVVCSMDKLLPGDGVYACWVNVDDVRYMSAVSVGSNPTVQGAHRTVECYLLDFSGDLYGQLITVSFEKMLRPMQRFGSLEELKSAIEANVAEVRGLLGF